MALDASNAAAAAGDAIPPRGPSLSTPRTRTARRPCTPPSRGPRGDRAPPRRRGRRPPTPVPSRSVLASPRRRPRDRPGARASCSPSPSKNQTHVPYSVPPWIASGPPPRASPRSGRDARPPRPADAGASFSASDVGLAAERRHFATARAMIALARTPPGARARRPRPPPSPRVPEGRRDRGPRTANRRERVAFHPRDRAVLAVAGEDGAPVCVRESRATTRPFRPTFRTESDGAPSHLRAPAGGFWGFGSGATRARRGCSDAAWSRAGNRVLTAGLDGAARAWALPKRGRRRRGVRVRRAGDVRGVGADDRVAWVAAGRDAAVFDAAAGDEEGGGDPSEGAWRDEEGRRRGRGEEEREYFAATRATTLSTAARALARLVGRRLAADVALASCVASASMAPRWDDSRRVRRRRRRLAARGGDAAAPGVLDGRGVPSGVPTRRVDAETLRPWPEPRPRRRRTRRLPRIIIIGSRRREPPRRPREGAGSRATRPRWRRAARSARVPVGRAPRPPPPRRRLARARRRRRRRRLRAEPRGRRGRDVLGGRHGGLFEPIRAGGGGGEGARELARLTLRRRRRRREGGMAACAFSTCGEAFAATRSGDARPGAPAAVAWEGDY